MNAHIINCDAKEFFNSFLPGGYLGVGLVIRGTTPQALSRACITTYSMYADMRTIRMGDIVFVHAGKKIYGAFEAVTEFCEEPSTPQHFLSRNLHYYPDSTKPGSGWKGNITEEADVGYYRRMAIKHFVDDRSNNLCFYGGIDSTEVFELKFKNKIWSVPERWKYGDTSRTVRPLMEDEAFELLRILDRSNSDDPNRQTIEPADLAEYLLIQPNLNPEVVTNEKIIEGWILGNIGKHPVLDDALGSFSSFGNNLPVAYLKFMDIFGYQELTTGIKKYKVVEVKKDNCVFPDHIHQLLGYTDWVAENIAGGDYKLVESIIIAKDFSSDCIDFVRNFNTTARNIRLVKFGYNPPEYGELNITRVV